jgi:hypothetical protein
MSTELTINSTIPAEEEYCQCAKCRRVLPTEGLENCLCESTVFKSISTGYLAKPEGLSEMGEQAYDTIIAFLAEKMWGDTGGCKAFYSPQEWRDRGESYGTDSELVVVYDGGDLWYIFNMDAMLYEIHEAMMEKFHPLDMFCEACTGWYSAIYEG